MLLIRLSRRFSEKENSRPGVIDANDAPRLQTIRVYVLNICDIPPDFVDSCSHNVQKDEGNEDDEVFHRVEHCDSELREGNGDIEGVEEEIG